MEYKFLFEEKEYVLMDNNLEYFYNNENNPVNGVDETKILQILNNSNNIEFTKAYFDLPCGECKSVLAEKRKVFDFLGFNFYIYTKDNDYISNNIEKEYEGQSFNSLQRVGKVNGSYIVIINVCRECGTYSIEIEEFEL